MATQWLSTVEQTSFLGSDCEILSWKVLTKPLTKTEIQKTSSRNPSAHDLTRVFGRELDAKTYANNENTNTISMDSNQTENHSLNKTEDILPVILLTLPSMIQEWTDQNTPEPHNNRGPQVYTLHQHIQKQSAAVQTSKARNRWEDTWRLYVNVEHTISLYQKWGLRWCSGGPMDLCVWMEMHSSKALLLSPIPCMLRTRKCRLEFLSVFAAQLRYK